MDQDHTSHWLKSATLPNFPSLDQDLSVDVVVVGAGITGVTAAYMLKQEGLSVALVERERCGGVDSAFTTAHVTAQPDLRLHELKDHFGAESAKAVWDAGTTAQNMITAIAHSENIDCQFKWVPGYLHAAKPDEDPELFQHDASIARELGIAAEFQAEVPHFKVPGVMFPRQALFHPLAYLGGLVRKVPGNGSHVFENTNVIEIEKEPRCVRTPGGKISFKHIVLATHNPLVGLSGVLRATLLQTKLSLYSSYAIGARLPTDHLPEGLFWDTADPYNYLRVQVLGDHAYAIYGGEDHKTGQETDTQAHYNRLEDRLRQFAPQAEVDARWSGQVIETADGLPFIGPTDEHQFIATGYAGNGMTFGTIAGMMAVDEILGRPNQWKKLFDPGRKVFHGGTLTYLKENKDYPLHLIRDRLAKPESLSLRDLAPGEGKVVQLRNRKVAAYRDPQGRVTLCSAVCTHLQCIVGWNPAEKTWDCPCHGSRFHPDGRVMSGPAEEPLGRLSPSTGLPLRQRHAPSTKKAPKTG